MQIETLRTRVVALALGALLAGAADDDGVRGPSSFDAIVPVVAVRGEAARDKTAREVAAQRALAQAVAAAEARRSMVAQKSGGETKPEAAELALTGPAGGVRLSVRGQLPSGFVYRRAEAERPGVAVCGGVAAPVAAVNDEAPNSEPGEVRP